MLSEADTVIKHQRYRFYDCPLSELIPLTSVRKKDGANLGKDKLIAASKSWNVGGGTGSNYGMYWAWATLEPVFFPVFGTAISDNPDDVKKYVVIMTDGINNDYRNDIDMLAACKEMKKRKITIYTIVLKTYSKEVLDIFEKCASPNASGRKYFIRTNQASGLSAVFQKIVQELGQFYISK